MGFSYTGEAPKNVPERSVEPEKVAFELSELKESEKINELPLTNDEAWELLFWSFEYSRGSDRLQKHIIEYLRRHLRIDESFGTSIVPEKMIDQVVARVGAGSHAQHVSDKHEFETKTRSTFVGYQPYLAGNIDVIREAAAEITHGDYSIDYMQFLIDTVFESAYHSSDEQLAESIVTLMLSADYYWVCERGLKRPPITSQFNNPKRPGGMPYDFLMSALKPIFHKIVNSSRQVEDHRGTKSKYSPLPSNEMYRAIQTKLNELRSAA